MVTPVGWRPSLLGWRPSLVGGPNGETSGTGKVFSAQSLTDPGFRAVGSCARKRQNIPESQATLLQKTMRGLFGFKECCIPLRSFAGSRKQCSP